MNRSFLTALTLALLLQPMVCAAKGAARPTAKPARAAAHRASPVHHAAPHLRIVARPAPPAVKPFNPTLWQFPPRDTTPGVWGSSPYDAPAEPAP